MEDPARMLGALEGLTWCVKLVKIGTKIQNDIPIESRSFVSLVQQVERDLEHAMTLSVEAGRSFRAYPKHHQAWVRSCMSRSSDVLCRVGLDFQDVGDDEEPLEGRALHYLHTEPAQFVVLEKQLAYSHTSLLAAINLMHLMLVDGIKSDARARPAAPTAAAQSRPSVDSAAAAPAALAEPQLPPVVGNAAAASGPPRLPTTYTPRRASRQRPLETNVHAPAAVLPSFPTPPGISLGLFELPSQPPLTVAAGVLEMDAQDQDSVETKKILAALQQLRAGDGEEDNAF